MKNKPTLATISVAILLLGPTLARGGNLQDLLDSRAKLKPFCATYLEKIEVFVGPKTREGIAGWGSKDSELELEASIDSHSSQMKYKTLSPENPMASGGARTYFATAEKTYTVIDGGERATFGKRHSGMTNPAAAGYELHGEPLERYAARLKLADNGVNRIQVDAHGTPTTIDIVRLNGQALIEKVTAQATIPTVLRVLDWVDYKGSKYPSLVTLEFTEGGQVTQRRTYTLLKINEDKSKPLELKWQEGAIVKDDDRNEVYSVVNGKFVLDPVFNKETQEQITLHRALFIAGFGLAGLALLWFARSIKFRTKPAT